MFNIYGLCHLVSVSSSTFQASEVFQQGSIFLNTKLEWLITVYLVI